ncbi:MAG: Bor family protein [Gemmatimonadetes bacterium]|nr:Bor family protein [Gemmatimonadota bacterium]
MSGASPCTGRGVIVLAVLLVSTSGCYHAIVESGRQQSGTIVEDKWADSFIAGLVPPNPVEVVQRCPNGIVRVETRHSFLNLLVESITFGIYSPMHIKVYCAAAGTDDAPVDPARMVHVGQRDVLAAMDRAAALSHATGQAAFVVLPTAR